jgi:cardiolipin synthase C
LLLLSVMSIAFSFSLSADYYRFLTAEKEAMQCRYDLIKQAETEILISCYIIQDDEVGVAVMQELLLARARGVRVCVLMDGNASDINPYLAYYLISRGVEIKEFYLEGAIQLRRYYHRLHDKLVLVDATKMIMGGRNLKNPYFEMHPSHNFKDREVYIESASCGITARQHFYYMWNAKRLTSKIKKLEPDPEREIRIGAELQRCKWAVVKACQIDTLLAINWSIGLEPTAQPVIFVHDKFVSEDGVRSQIKDAGSTDSLIQLIYKAQKHITLENAYIVPTRKWQHAFQDAVDRGVKIRLLTNSIKSNDVLISQAAYMNHRGKLIKMGIEVWEYQGPKQFHAKTATLDDCVSVVGSYNIHNPSEAFNSEVAVWVFDSEIATIHRENIEEYLEGAVRIGKNNKPDPSSFPNYQKTKFGRRAKTFMLRYTIAWAFGRLL